MTILPLLILVELLFLPFLAWRARRLDHITTTQMVATLLPVAGLATWTAVTATLGVRGVYSSEGFYQLYSAIWVPGIPIAIVLASLAVPSVRMGIASSLDATPAHWLAFFQAGRLSAIGTLYHMWRGDFPLYFSVVVGIPDLLFGLSALVVGMMAAQKRIRGNALIAWHLVGCLIIVPTAPVLLGSWLTRTPACLHATSNGRSCICIPHEEGPDDGGTDVRVIQPVSDLAVLAWSIDASICSTDLIRRTRTATVMRGSWSYRRQRSQSGIFARRQARV